MSLHHRALGLRSQVMRLSYSDLDERRANSRNGSKADVARMQNFLSYRLRFVPSRASPDSFGTRLILLLNSDRGFEGDGGLLA